MSQSYFLAFCGGEGGITLYFWASTLGNSPASSFPSPVLLKLKGTALLHARSSSKRTLFPARFPRLPGHGREPAPHSGARASWSAPPRGETKAASGAQGHCATSPRLPLRRRPRSGELGASGLAAAKPAPLSPAGPRRGWGEGSPALCLVSPRLSSGSHPPHHCLISSVRWRGATARPRQPPPQARGPRRSAGPAASPRKPGRTEHPSPRHARTR